MQAIGQKLIRYRLENDCDVARREWTVIISIESITDVKTCNRARTASDEAVQSSGSKVAEQGTQIEFNLVS